MRIHLVSNYGRQTGFNHKTVNVEPSTKLIDCVHEADFPIDEKGSMHIFYTIYDDFTHPIEAYGVHEDDVLTFCPKIPLC